MYDMSAIHLRQCAVDKDYILDVICDTIDIIMYLDS